MISLLTVDFRQNHLVYKFKFQNKSHIKNIFYYYYYIKILTDDYPRGM